jgi:hypothetical protein
MRKLSSFYIERASNGESAFGSLQSSSMPGQDDLSFGAVDPIPQRAAQQTSHLARLG